MRTKRERELALMLESAARSALGTHVMAPCDDVTRERIRKLMEALIKNAKPEAVVEVIDRTPKTVEEKVAFMLMGDDYTNTMHVEVRLQLTAEYVTMTLNLPDAEASADTMGKM